MTRPLGWLTIGGPGSGPLALPLPVGKGARAAGPHRPVGHGGPLNPKKGFSATAVEVIFVVAEVLEVFLIPGLFGFGQLR